jgi:hypothetical protein
MNPAMQIQDGGDPLQASPTLEIEVHSPIKGPVQNHIVQMPVQIQSPAFLISPTSPTAQTTTNTTPMAAPSHPKLFIPLDNPALLHGDPSENHMQAIVSKLQTFVENELGDPRSIVKIVQAPEKNATSTKKFFRPERYTPFKCVHPERGRHCKVCEKTHESPKSHFHLYLDRTSGGVKMACRNMSWKLVGTIPLSDAEKRTLRGPIDLSVEFDLSGDPKKNAK